MERAANPTIPGQIIHGIRSRKRHQRLVSSPVKIVPVRAGSLSPRASEQDRDT
jgi:hypothetical protein